MILLVAPCFANVAAMLQMLDPTRSLQFHPCVNYSSVYCCKAHYWYRIPIEVRNQLIELDGEIAYTSSNVEEVRPVSTREFKFDCIWNSTVLGRQANLAGLNGLSQSSQDSAKLADLVRRATFIGVTMKCIDNHFPDWEMRNGRRIVNCRRLHPHELSALMKSKSKGKIQPVSESALTGTSMWPTPAIIVADLVPGDFDTEEAFRPPSILYA